MASALDDWRLPMCYGVLQQGCVYYLIREPDVAELAAIRATDYFTDEEIDAAVDHAPTSEPARIEEDEWSRIPAGTFCALGLHYDPYSASQFTLVAKPRARDYTPTHFVQLACMLWHLSNFASEHGAVCTDAHVTAYCGDTVVRDFRLA